MKMRYLPLVFCILPFLLQAQGQPRFHYGIAFAPGAAIALDAGDSEKQQLRPSVDLGFRAGYRFHSRWSVSAGLAYASTGRKYEPVVPGNDFEGEPGFETPDPPVFPGGGPGNQGRTRSLTQAYHFLAVPLRVTYHGNAGRSWRPYVSAGLSPRLLLLHREKKTAAYSDGKIERSTRDYETEPLHFSLMLSAGVTHDLANGHQVFVGPNLQWVNVREQRYAQKDARQLLQMGLEIGYLW